MINKMADESDIRTTKRSRRARGPGLTAKGDKRKFVEHNYVDHGNENELSDGCEDEYDHEILQRYRQYASNIEREGLGGKNKCGPFPFRFHMILSEIESDGNAHIVSWLSHGRSFAIHKQGLFQAEIMPKYFKQSKITSFHRQLNLYGYQRLTHGRDCGSYYHEYFLRGKPFLTRKMIRTKVKGTKIRAASSPDDEPNFHDYPPVGTPLPAYGSRPSNFAVMPGVENINTFSSSNSSNFTGRGGSNDIRRGGDSSAAIQNSSLNSSLSSQIAAQGLIGLSDLQHPPFHHSMYHRRPTTTNDVSNALIHRHLAHQSSNMDTLSALSRLEAASSSFGAPGPSNADLLLNSYLTNNANSNLSSSSNAAAAQQQQQALLLSMAHQANPYYLPSDHVGRIGGGRLYNLASPSLFYPGRSVLPTSTDHLSGGSSSSSSAILPYHLRMMNNEASSLPLGSNLLPNGGNSSSSLSPLLDERYLEALRCSNGDISLSSLGPRVSNNNASRMIIGGNQHDRGQQQTEQLMQLAGSSNNSNDNGSILYQDRRRVDLLMQQERTMVLEATRSSSNFGDNNNTTASEQQKKGCSPPASKKGL